MPIKNYIISLLIISITVIGGTCLFGFCVQADSGEIIDSEIINSDIPVIESVIKEDGKLNGQTLKVRKPDINFGSDFSLADNQKKVIKAENKKKNKINLAKTIQNGQENANAQKISIEMNSILDEIKKQGQEVQNLLSELKKIKTDIPESDKLAKSNNVVRNKDNIIEEKSSDNNIESQKLVQQSNIVNITKAEPEIQNTVLDSKNDLKVHSKVTTAAKKIKHTPMIVEDAQSNSYKSSFKDYSKDNSGRKNNEDINGGFEKAFSALRPEKLNTKKQNLLSERRKKSNITDKVSKDGVKNFHNAYVNIDDVKKDFYKTYITENKYLKPFETEDDGDEVQNKKSGKRGHDILQLKIEFQENSASLSAVDVNILRYFVYIAQNDPTKGVQISISQDNMKDINKKKLAARRLAIVSAIFKEEGLSDSQIIPILTDRDTESFTFSIISIDKMENFQKNEGKDMFGDNIGSSQTFKTMRW